MSTWCGRSCAKLVPASSLRSSTYGYEHKLPSNAKDFFQRSTKEFPVGVPVQNVEASKMMIPSGCAGMSIKAAGAVVALCLPMPDYISGQVVEDPSGLSRANSTT